MNDGAMDRKTIDDPAAVAGSSDAAAPASADTKFETGRPSARDEGSDCGSLNAFALSVQPSVVGSLDEWRPGDRGLGDRGLGDRRLGDRRLGDRRDDDGLDRIDDGKGGVAVTQSRGGLRHWMNRGVARARGGLQTFQVTIAHPCPYLPSQLERKIWTLLDDGQAPDYGGLARGGFRRSHTIAYRPACPTCSACVPVRVSVERFHWTKSFRRIWKANTDLIAVERPVVATGEQFRLFQRYLNARHHDGEMAGMTALDYRGMVEDSPTSSRVMELRRPCDDNPAVGAADQDRPDRLTAACLVDVMDDGLSAVYSFFEPDLAHRSLGSQIVLWLVERARTLGRPYVYLGYWIGGSRKMAYKARFRPLQGLVDGHWRDVNANAGTQTRTAHPHRYTALD